MYFQEFCWRLKHNLTESEIDKLMIRKSADGSQLEIDCFADNLDVYLQVS